MSPETARSLLQLPATATPDDVERAFRRLAQERHPDHGGEAESFCRLLQARAVLHDAGLPPSQLRAPVIVVHRGPWWRRLRRALLHCVYRRRNPPPSRVT
jgi:hypothetical protein